MPASLGEGRKGIRSLGTCAQQWGLRQGGGLWFVELHPLWREGKPPAPRSWPWRQLGGTASTASLAKFLVPVNMSYHRRVPSDSREGVLVPTWIPLLLLCCCCSAAALTHTYTRSSLTRTHLESPKIHKHTHLPRPHISVFQTLWSFTSWATLCPCLSPLLFL